MKSKIKQGNFDADTRLGQVVNVISRRKRESGNLSILDIGCVGSKHKRYGHPFWVHGIICEAIGNGSEVIGIDIDAENVNKIPREYRRHIVIADAQDFHLDRKFDLIFGLDIIEHLGNPLGFLQCTKEHLKDDGALVVTTPNLNSGISVLRNIFRIGETKYHPYGHVCGFTPSLIENLVRRAGMDADVEVISPDDPPNSMTKLLFKVLPTHKILCVARLNGRSE